MDTIDRQTLTTLTEIPYFYFEVENSAIQAVIMISSMIAIFVNILIFKGLLTFKSITRPKILLEISLNRIYPLILPILFSYYTTSIFACIMSVATAIGFIICSVLSYREKLNQQRFEFFWMSLRLINLGFWFGLSIHVFFEFT